MTHSRIDSQTSFIFVFQNLLEPPALLGFEIPPNLIRQLGNYRPHGRANIIAVAIDNDPETITNIRVELATKLVSAKSVHLAPNFPKALSDQQIRIPDLDRSLRIARNFFREFFGRNQKTKKACESILLFIRNEIQDIINERITYSHAPTNSSEIAALQTVYRGPIEMHTETLHGRGASAVIPIKVPNALVKRSDTRIYIFDMDKMSKGENALVGSYQFDPAAVPDLAQENHGQSQTGSGLVFREQRPFSGQ